MDALLFLIVVLVVVVAFTVTNGFHDAANAIATVVSTKVLTPRQAVLLAAVANFIGALGGTAVAKTVGAGMVGRCGRWGSAASEPLGGRARIGDDATQTARK